jgi:microcystin degradation protein MlrC
VATPLSSWKIAEGEDLLKLRGTKTNVGGILEVADREGWELLPTLLAAAVPSKPTDAGTYANLKERIFSPMRREKPDAVILCMHGAMMAEGTDDPEGDLVSAARKIIGDRPLIITLDLHGNNTKETALGSDGVFGFDTNPHIDAYERALEAAECLAKALKGEWKPVTAHAHAPMLPPTINMRTAEGPMAALFARAREWEAKPGMINVSVFGGFPYCDVPYVGLNVIATADNDKELAQAACDDICARAWENRDQFLKKIAPISEAMEQAKALVAKNPKRRSS